MIDDDGAEEQPPLGLTRDEWRDMLADIERREVINAKRAATRKRRSEEATAARLARPPLDLQKAWRRHADKCPSPPYSEGAREWFRENRLFEFDGTVWTRTVTRQISNSGKSYPVRSIVFRSINGRTENALEDRPNRRNDADRDWGLPD